MEIEKLPIVISIIEWQNCLTKTVHGKGSIYFFEAFSDDDTFLLINKDYRKKFIQDSWVKIKNL